MRQERIQVYRNATMGKHYVFPIFMQERNEAYYD